MPVSTYPEAEQLSVPPSIFQFPQRYVIRQAYGRAEVEGMAVMVIQMNQDLGDGQWVGLPAEAMKQRSVQAFDDFRRGDLNCVYFGREPIRVWFDGLQALRDRGMITFEEINGDVFVFATEALLGPIEQYRVS